MWAWDIRVAAASDPGLEKHAANGGSRGPTHSAVSALCWRYCATCTWSHVHRYKRKKETKKILNTWNTQSKYVHRNDKTKEMHPFKWWSTWILHVSRGIGQAKHPVQVGCQEAVPTQLVPDQFLAVMKAVDDGHHWLKGYLCQIGCRKEAWIFLKNQVIKWVQWMKNKSDYLPNLASNLMIYGIFFSFAVLVK